jgi:hypothetical protein
MDRSRREPAVSRRAFPHLAVLALLAGLAGCSSKGDGTDNPTAPSPGTGPVGYTAIGASFINGSTVSGYERDGRPVTEEERVNTFEDYRRRTPEKIFGGSIYLFREDGQ